MTVKAWLDGDRYDLGDLAAQFPSGDVQVAPDGDAFYLASPEIDSPRDGRTFYEVAQTLLVYINGIARVTRDNFRPVTLSGRYSTPTGEQVVGDVGEQMVGEVLPLGELRIRGHIFAAATVTRSDGTIVPDEPPPGPGYAALAASHTDVADALRIMGQPKELAWADLYKVYEIICDAIRPQQITQLGSNTNTRDSAFRVSANNPDISGDDARHARPPRGDQPKQTMSLAEGNQFVRNLVTAWLNSLRNP